ncbi:MAG TPA: response regulator [Anaeromyxobacteraceae bacterium]|nr:response regulator [Anaeromyxobacteraceae bacterium]
MSKKILLIENDAAIASELTRVLEARGLEVRVTGDGKEGLELARDGRPDAVVLCVELPRMSGYSVCQKLKKDEALRAIPVVLTSAEATEETFEAHRKLKARADDYLIKPYAPAALLAKLGALLHLPDAPGEEMVTLDDVEELSGEIPLIPEGERVRPSDALPAEDEDLRLLDSAFDSIAGEPRAEAPPLPALRRPPDEGAAGADERPVGGEELRAAAELLPPEDEAVGHGEIDKLGEEADRALAALGAEEAGEGVDLAGGALGDEPPAAPPPPSGEPDAQRLRERVSELLIELAHSRDRAKGHEAELQTARAAAEREAQGRRDTEERLRQAEEAVRQGEEKARQASERAAQLEERDHGASERVARLEEQLTALRLQAEETAQTASLKAAQVAALEAEASGLRSQLDAAQADLETSRAALDATRDDAEKRVAEAQKRLQELEAVNAKHEERIVKAYQKIKGDEKIREKTRKALAIALQLLDERIAATPPKEPGEPAPRRE